MKKKPIMISLDDGVVGSLSKMGDRYGLSANQILAAAAYELSRVRTENLWHALGRIADGEAVELMPGDRQPLPNGRRTVRKALPA